MGERQALIVAAAVAAVLGAAALVTAAGWIAALAGIAAIAVASLALRGRVPGAAPEPPAVAVPETEPEDEPEDEPLIEPVPHGGGVLDEHVLDTMLRSRIAIARRTLQPLSVIHVDVGGSTPPDPSPDALAVMFEQTLRESDVLGLRSDGIYVFVLADTGEDGAVWTAERLRRRIAADFRDRVFAAGIACYPSHGLEADEVDAKASLALDAAREWNRDRIEVATV